MFYGIKMSQYLTILYVSEKVRHKTAYTIGFRYVKQTQGHKKKDWK